MTDAVVTVAGQTLRLLPERAAFWQEARTLLVADLHWGKSQTFRALGMPVPGDALEDDLARLRRALERTDAARLVVLGDLIHAREGVTPDVTERVGAWRRAHPVPALLVRGNHDRHVPELPAEWRIGTVAGVCTDGPFRFVHDPDRHRDADGYVLAGHIHPAARVGRGRTALRVPAFHFGEEVGVLPAFGSFTGGTVLPRRPTDRVYGIADDEVFALLDR